MSDSRADRPDDTRRMRLQRILHVLDASAMLAGEAVTPRVREERRCATSDFKRQAQDVLAEAEKELGQFRDRWQLTRDALAAALARTAMLEADLAGERARIAEIEKERDVALAKFDAVAADAGMLVKLAAEYEEAAAKVARYEALGPALLEDDDDLECPLCGSEPHDHFQAVDCMRAGAKQQHARDVALVEAARLPEEHTTECDARAEEHGERRCGWGACLGDSFSAAEKKQHEACLAALREGAAK